MIINSTIEVMSDTSYKYWMCVLLYLLLLHNVYYQSTYVVTLKLDVAI